MTMRSALRALILGAVMAVLPATGASADVFLRADEAVPRVCHETASGQAVGVAERRYTPAAGGLLTIRLRGSETAGDWDLAAFRVSDNRLLGASSSFGSAETVVARAQAGEEVAIRACRRLGGGHTVPLTIDLYEMAFPQPGGTAQLVEVPVGGARGLARLEDTGADVTHDVTVRNGVGFAKVVVYSAAERERLADAGFPAQVLVSDLRAVDTAQRRAELRSAAPPPVRALPSGRTTYREPQDYTTELKQLAEANPGFVRKVTLPLPSVEGRPIEGVEIASEVNRTDDGRPVYIQMGAHHAREWPSAELPMEFAIDLVKGFKAGDPRVVDLMSKVRTIVIPVVNPDGFTVSRTAGPMAGDEDSDATLALAVNDQMAYKRKNCRPTVPGSELMPCAARSGSGVDLNRNYGAYWGGPGSSSDVSTQGYRGPAPYSEPESEAVHRFTAGLHVVTFITNHTFTADGKFLRQPGFEADFLPDRDGNGRPVTPDEAAMKQLGDAMAAPSGWTSELGYETLGDITGATEDWNYFAQGTFGYTPEARGPNFHANYAENVADEYTGVGENGGVREAFLVAGEQAANTRDHSVIAGSATPGRVLRLRKSFSTPTSMAGLVIGDTLDTTMTVPASGAYEWHVNPSKRPFLGTAGEAWTMTCETAAGAVLSTAQVEVARGQRVTQNLCPAAGGGSGPAACDAPTGRLGVRRLDRVRLGTMRRVPRAAFARRESGRRTVDRFCLTGRGSLRVGYPGASLLRRLSARERSRVGGRAVLLLTSSPRYALRGARPGATSASLPARIVRARGIRIGVNTWYLLRGKRARVAIKVRRGIVGEVGLADLRLTRGRARATRFLRSFG